jgi:hypothetical protein
MSYKRVRVVSLTFGRLKNLRQILWNERFFIYLKPKSPPGAPRLAFRDPKPNMESVDTDPHLNPVTYLPVHKQSRIEGWPNPRADEKLD